MKKLAFVSFLLAVSSGSALAADLAARPYSKAPAMISPAYDWSGFYIGANVGGAWIRESSSTTALNGAVGGGGNRGTGLGGRSGVVGGGQIGYNFMVAPNFLLGIEADVDGTSLSGSALSPSGADRGNAKIDAFGTVRGRVGFTQNNWLFYGTGGFAWSTGSVTRTQIVAQPTAVPPIPAAAGTVETSSNTRTGWAAGGGVEWGFAQNWTVKAEYLYLDLGKVTSVFPLANRMQTNTLTMNVARIGVNYKFGGPAVARY
jgi:outer membrane immunogenic protein